VRIEELPKFLQTLGNQNGSFDPLHILYHHVFRSGYLHFGFWPEEHGKDADLQAVLESLRSAQARFADELLATMPKGTHRVLDVGAGFGRFSLELLRQGHSVTAITPCRYQAQQIVDQSPEIRVEHGRFQEVAWNLPSGSFDIILFSESFRYIPLKEAFQLFDRLLSRNGHLVLADWFAHNYPGARHGHDHNDQAFRDAARDKGFAIVSERDVTKNVLPTVQLAYDVLCEFYLPLAGFVLAKFAQKRPRLFRLCLKWIIRWIEKKVLPQLPGRCDPMVFAAQYKYFFFVLRRASLD
jgi:SAM-dependent methyltransferase